MANLVRIRDVTVYTAFGEKVTECWNLIKLLKENNVPYSQLNWNSDEEFAAANVFAPLNSWNYTSNGETYHNKTFTQIPIVHWKNVFDNDVIGIDAAAGITELQNSQLFANLDKVVRPS